jgi:hypothetical protein
MLLITSNRFPLDEASRKTLISNHQVFGGCEAVENDSPIEFTPLRRGEREPTLYQGGLCCFGGVVALAVFAACVPSLGGKIPSAEASTAFQKRNKAILQPRRVAPIARKDDFIETLARPDSR